VFKSCATHSMVNAEVKAADVLRYLKTHSSLETAWNACDRADWMLWFLESTLRMGMVENEFESRVRLFAVWCARACLKAFKVHPTAEQAVSAAEAFAQGRASSQELSEAHKNASNGATAAGVVGLSKQLPSASAQLCCFHTANVNAFEAARQCSIYHLKAVLDYATQEGAKKLGWKGALSSFTQATAPVLDALESATRASQANALREIMANPFAGKLALRRAPRDETGVPLTPDIAYGALNEFYGLRLSETPRKNELSESEMEIAVGKIVVALVRRYRPVIAEHGAESAKREFGCFRLLMLNAGDFDPVLDAPAMRAYEIAEGLLFKPVR
jgi:hypothetical protein